MPLTPFHHPLAYLIYRFDARLSLPALVVGSMLPDLEIPVIILFFANRIPSHLVLHSLLGAATVGTGLSVIFTGQAYPRLVGALFGIQKRELEGKCRLSLSLVFSALLGSLSHVLLDFAVHVHNAIFWPFISDTPSPVVSVLGDQYAQLLVHALLGVILLVLSWNKRESLVESLLVK